MTHPAPLADPRYPAFDDQRPVSPSQRIASLDFVRGVAVLGILFANIVGFGHTMLAYVWPPAMPGGASVADGWMWLVQYTAVDGKFRGLFSLLFGAGFYLFVQRDEARGGTGFLQVRRLIWLALFGLLHFYLLFEGDILAPYALAGFILLPMVHWHPGTQIKVGLGMWACFSLFMGLSVYLSSQQWAQFLDTQNAVLLRDQAEAAVLGGPDYFALVLYRLHEQTGDLVHMIPLALQETVPMALIGMALLRLGLFSGAVKAQWLGWFGAVLSLGGAVMSGIIGYAALARGFPFWYTQYIYHGAALLPRLIMTLGYLCILLAICDRALATGLGQRIAAAGRMALSNYLACSLVMALVFQGWAGGLFNQLDRLALLVPLTLGWAAMLWWSQPWLARFNYGPLEWLWRSLTYQKKFALRRNRAC